MDSRTEPASCGVGLGVAVENESSQNPISADSRHVGKARVSYQQTSRYRPDSIIIIDLPSVSSELSTGALQLVMCHVDLIATPEITSKSQVSTRQRVLLSLSSPPPAIDCTCRTASIADTTTQSAVRRLVHITLMSMT